jgi:Na+-transporting methylmalonyl-CoA/oxaloacetate decarboxylase gamma subunit
MALIWFSSCFVFVIGIYVKVGLAPLILGVIIYVGLLLLNAYFILRISQVIRRHAMQIQAQQNSVQQSINMPKYKKSVNTIYYVIAAFILCFGPSAITLLVFTVFRKVTPFLHPMDLYGINLLEDFYTPIRNGV